MKTQLLILATCIAAASCQAALVWTGAENGASAYAEGNWLDDNGQVPADGTVNGNATITAATGGLIEINAGVGTPNNYGGNFITGSGVDLAVGNGKELTTSGTAGIRQTTGSGVANTDFAISGASTVRAQYIVDFDITLDGGSTLTLKGDGTPLNGATVDLLDLNSVIQFNEETEAAFISEHLSKCTVNGAPMVLGVNATASAYNGASGVQIQAIEPASAGTKPNIILIFTDDLGYGDLGVLFQNNRPGIKKLSTPSLDSMAAEGTILDRHYCPAPVCAPSRGSLLSGQHQGHASVRNSQFDKALEDNHNLATTLKAAGYSTAIIGKYGLQGTSGSSPATWAGYPTKRGFDYFLGYARHTDGHQHYPANEWPLGNTSAHRAAKELYENDAEISADLDKCYTTDLFTARAKQMIIDKTTTNPAQPFFIYLAYDTPHAALQLPTMAYPAGKGIAGGLQWNGTAGNMINTASGVIDSYINPLYAGNGWPNGDERFATMVTRIDHCVGDLLQTLKDLGIDDNTIVVFTSDNGPHNESYLTGVTYTPQAFQSYGPFEGMKRDCNEGGIRVPSLAWGPGRVLAGTVNSTPSQFHDWMPTFCDYAEIPAPARTDGVSLVPTLSGTGTQKTNTVYIEFTVGGSVPNYADFPNHGGDSRAETQVIYLDGYKGIRNNIASHAQDFRIYDTLTDLPEATNLANSSAYFIDLQQRMKDKVLRIRQPDPAASRPYDNELVPPVSAVMENGLVVKTYEGAWPWVPEFEALSEISESNVVNISTGHLSRSTDAGLLYTGYIRIPVDGTWTFYTTSDEGTTLRIHDSLVLDDDFNHTGAEVSGSIMLKSGLHPIRLYYRSGGSAPALNIKWSGPGTAKADLPDHAVFRDGTPPPIPVANDDVASTYGAAPVSIMVLANDYDDGLPAALSIQSVSETQLGTATISGNSILYTADAGKYGTDQFTYTISDGQHTAEATVTVNVSVEVTNPWLPLNETSGNSVAEAGGSLVGVLVGFADPEAAHIAGKHQYALTFDGVNEQVNLSNLTLPIGNSPRTVSAWVRVPTTPGEEYQSIFTYGKSVNGQRFSLRLDTANPVLRLEVQGGYIKGSTPLNDGAWHHVAVVVDDFNSNGITDVNEAKLYVDGSLESVSGSSSEPINTDPTGIPALGGSNHDGGYNFKGDIDDVRIFNTAFSGPEVAALAAESSVDIDGNLWYFRNLGSANPVLADWEAVSNAGGYSHYQAYALGGSPHWLDAGMVPVFAQTTGGFDYAYNRRRALDPADYLLETTTTLTNTVWNPVPGGMAAAHPELPEYEVVTVPISTDDTTNSFYRLKIAY